MALKSCLSTILLVFFVGLNCFADKNDSLLQVQIEQLQKKNTRLETKLSELERSVQLIDSSQLNYRIEKDLLKETYSNNYDRINIFVALLLGVAGFLAFLGLRDINAIKDKYTSELEKLQELKKEFDFKSKKFDDESEKVNKELKEIIEENQAQSQQIKFIELKEKAGSLLKGNSNSSALEFINAALAINEEADLFSQKGRCLTRLNELEQGVLAFEKAIELSPDNPSYGLNYVEALLFKGEIVKADALLDEKPELVTRKPENEQEVIKGYLKALRSFHGGSLDEMNKIASEIINEENVKIRSTKPNAWSFEEAKHFAHYQEDGALKTALKNLIWYWDGQITGKMLLERLGLEVPIPDDEGSGSGSGSGS